MLHNNLPTISDILTDLLVPPSSFYSVEKEKSGFPPYNILEIGDLTYRIDVGLSGFTKDDIELSRENNTLFIKSNGPKEKKKR
jgi:HSP20 family molecular chaperone IbpA